MDTKTENATLANPSIRRKVLAVGLLLFGVTLIAASLYFALTPTAEQETGSYLKTAAGILGALLGAIPAVKALVDLLKKDPPTTTQTATATDQAQAAVGDHPQAIKAETVYTGPVTQIIARAPEPPSLGPRLHQLPPAPPDFTGREPQIAEILQDFNQHKGATISGLTGMGGIGKTALGLVIAHLLEEKYCDAQIFLDLKGTTTPLSPLDIAQHIILSFVPQADVRGLTEENAVPSCMGLLHGKQALLFLDNARSEAQVQPFVPEKTSALLVTSRWNFAVPGLQSHRLGVLKPDEAEKFLLELCPRIREHASELPKACGYLPLALRIAGSFLLVNPDRPVQAYVEDLKTCKKALP